MTLLKNCFIKGPHFLREHPALSGLLLFQILIFIIEFFLCKETAKACRISAKTLAQMGALNHADSLSLKHATCATFLHADIVHLSFNMLTLYGLGRSFEKIMGPFVTLFFFLLAGIISNAFSSLYHCDGLTVGASGALVAMATSLMFLDIWKSLLTKGVLNVCRTLDAAPKCRLQSLIALVTSLVPVAGNIDYAAHLGGLIAGIIVTFTYLIFKPHPKAVF